MGSFAELQLSFYFRADVPDTVLAPFAALRVPGPSGWEGSPPEPGLPAFVPDPDEEWWDPTDHVADHGRPDPEPLTHDWSRVLSTAMDVTTVPTAALAWSPIGRWHLSCRCSFKDGAHEIHQAIRWLGPYMHSWDPPAGSRPTLVGHILDENARRPLLLWCQHGELSLEDLNSEDDWY